MAVISYKCPNCGGELVFDPKTQKYKCAYCMSDFTQEELDAANPQASAPDAAETDSTADAAQAAQTAQNAQTAGDTQKTENGDGQNAVVYTCPSCGAEIVTDETTAATFCYYCHNPVVLQGRLSGSYLPSKVIPFQIDKKQATDEFLNFVGKKKFVPKNFFNKKQIEKLTGVYFPYWVCDYGVKGQLNATGTKVRVYRMGDDEITETSFYRIERLSDLDFSNLTANALKKADHNLIEGVQPYQFDKAVDFNMGYLSGFQAEKRDLEKTDVKPQMENTLNQSAHEAMRDSVKGYATVTGEQVDISKTKEDWQYCLLPAWVLTYHAKNGKLYYYAMNGQTKKVYGELPVDYTKIAVMGGIIFAVVLILALIGGYYI